jgi:hypothetical protein
MSCNMKARVFVRSTVGQWVNWVCRIVGVVVQDIREDGLKFGEFCGGQGLCHMVGVDAGCAL